MAYITSGDVTVTVQNRFKHSPGLEARQFAMAVLTTNTEAVVYPATVLTLNADKFGFSNIVGIELNHGVDASFWARAERTGANTNTVSTQIELAFYSGNTSQTSTTAGATTIVTNFTNVIHGIVIGY